MRNFCVLWDTTKKIFKFVIDRIKSLISRTIILEARMEKDKLWELFEKTGHPLWYVLKKQREKEERR